MSIKQYFVTLLLIFTFLGAHAQEEIFSFVDDMPRFPGCELVPDSEIKNCAQKRMYTFIRQNVKYPKSAYEAGITGRSIIQFVVNKDGSLSDYKVPKPNNPALDQEALRVVKAMPFWRPGKKEGKLVRVKITLPIKFQLEMVPEPFTKVADLFCEQYMAEILSIEKLKVIAASSSSFENTDLCGVNGVPAKLLKFTLTHTVDDKETVLQSNDGSWSKAMQNLLTNIKAGESISLDYSIEYAITADKAFVQEEFRLIVAK